MVFAYHLIFAAYGFWLPNDPRGSWSDFVGSWELLRYGKATKGIQRWPLEEAPHDRALLLQAKQAMQYPAVHFTGQQALSIADGFRTAKEEAGYVLYACSILPEHMHLVLARHDREVTHIVGHLKAKATMALTKHRMHPLGHHRGPDGTIPTPWAQGCWRVFLDAHQDVVAAVQYVEENPEREGLRRQQWGFVTPYRM